MTAGPPATLGDVLYSDPSIVPPPENGWLRLVQSTAGGDELALHALYERTHRIVFTLISRLTRDPQTADDLTLEVYCDLWREAPRYNAADATVLGWLMRLARSRALDRQAADRSAGSNDVLLELPRAASLQERLAHRIAAETGRAPVSPTSQQWLEPEWVGVAPGISCKFLSKDAERRRISMLVRLVPEGEYPAHTHAGVEELHLLQGELWIDGRKLYPGDYNRAEPGTGDKRVWSETGCACVLVTSTSDVLRAPDSAREAPQLAPPEDTYRATIMTAASLVGPARLARRLQVPMADLNRWMAGHDRPSMGTFLKVVDLLIEESNKPRFR
jgi:DNA-directed RNA polymerase specialized sigma24 family protein